jgi:putative oxidoreductase
MYTTLFRSEAAAPTRTNLVALILRLSLAVVFLFHGLEKIVQGSAGATWVNEMYARMPDQPSRRLEAQRTPLHQLPTSLTVLGVQLAVAWGEFLGGLALAAGLLTRLAALGLIIIQIGAVILVTAPRGFSFDRGGGYEYNLALITMCLAVLILGGGRWSVDCLLMRQRALRAQTAASSPPLPLAGPHGAPSAPVEQVAPGAIR